MSPPTIVSQWTYQGVLGGPTAFPELIVELFSPPCTPRFVVWAGFFEIDLGLETALVIVSIVKFDRSFFTIDDWDSYWIGISINGIDSDEFIEHRVTIEDNYSIYQNNTPGNPWTWTNGGAPFQTVSWTQAFPCAWDRTMPGPPFPNNPPP